ncbi:Retrovirus-related Pol polyprotein from transposon TNT 1-94 [Bienertia sinuspersici]
MDMNENDVNMEYNWDSNDSAMWDDILEQEQSYDDNELITLRKERKTSKFTSNPLSSEEDLGDKDGDADAQLSTHKKKKYVKYSAFNEKSDMRRMELSIRMKWQLTSGKDIEDLTCWQIKSLIPKHDKWCKTGNASRISQKLEEAYEEQRHYNCRWNGEDSQTGFENLLQPVPKSSFWNHEGEGLVLPPDLVKKGLGKKKTVRRKDSDEPSKGKVKYNRKGLSRKCGNCGEIGHFKNKCPLPLKSKEPREEALTTIGRTWDKGRKKWNKNRIGTSCDEVHNQGIPTPTEYVNTIIKLKKANTILGSSTMVGSHSYNRKRKRGKGAHQEGEADQEGGGGKAEAHQWELGYSMVMMALFCLVFH